jgi:hypothetical protein
VRWYNHEHPHSAIRFVTPDDGCGDVALLAARHLVYERARADNPDRWSGNTSDWDPIKEVKLSFLTSMIQGDGEFLTSLIHSKW